MSFKNMSHGEKNNVGFFIGSIVMLIAQITLIFLGKGTICLILSVFCIILLYGTFQALKGGLVEVDTGMKIDGKKVTEKKHVDGYGFTKFGILGMVVFLITAAFPFILGWLLS